MKMTIRRKDSTKKYLDSPTKHSEGESDEGRGSIGEHEGSIHEDPEHLNNDVLLLHDNATMGALSENFSNGLDDSGAGSYGGTVEESDLSKTFNITEGTDLFTNDNTEEADANENQNPDEETSSQHEVNTTDNDIESALSKVIDDELSEETDTFDQGTYETRNEVDHLLSSAKKRDLSLDLKGIQSADEKIDSYRSSEHLATNRDDIHPIEKRIQDFFSESQAELHMRRPKAPHKKVQVKDPKDAKDKENIENKSQREEGKAEVWVPEENKLYVYNSEPRVLQMKNGGTRRVAAISKWDHDPNSSFRLKLR